jgi:transcriptional regulator of acetoin/glycerol metabolism
MRCIAIPVRDAGGRVLAAISSCGEASAICAERQPQILEALGRAAAAIEANICRSGGPSPFRLPSPAAPPPRFAAKPIDLDAVA